MIVTSPSANSLNGFRADICVIGGGPVGIVTALALNDAGFRVLMLESGFRHMEPGIQALSQAININPTSHHPPELAVARRLGGTSNLWGGRCIPFDPIDYAARPWLRLEAWPLNPEDLTPWVGPACHALGASTNTHQVAYESKLPAVDDSDSAFSVTKLERWSNVPRTHVLHRRALEERRTLMVALGSTVLGFRYSGDSISALDLHVEGRGQCVVRAHHVILAAGGNESTRLLLIEQQRRPWLFGGIGGPLGRYYMGHLSGQIADIVLDDDTLHSEIDFRVDTDGSYVRRRLTPSAETQRRVGIANIALWPVVPPISDPAHRSGPLSALLLGLTFTPLARQLLAEPIRLRHVGVRPYRRMKHALNVLKDIRSTVSFMPWFLWHNRMAKMRLPGFFLPNAARRYGLEYHSEHLPSPESRLTLAGSQDRLGMPRLAIDLRFSEDDAASVVTAHQAFETWLLRTRLGRLLYRAQKGSLAQAVLTQAKHGAHQIGTIRMGSDRSGSVVDRNCLCFDIPNLHIVSTAVLPTSGQATPTLMATMLGLRLASILKSNARPTSLHPARRDIRETSSELAYAKRYPT